MSRYFATRNLKTSSDYTEKIKNVEMMKSAKTSKSPTNNYLLQGDVFESFLNYETYLGLVKGFTDMRFILCEDCKCNLNAPLSIIDGISSFKCGEFSLCDKCKTVLYPYGRFINQNLIEEDPCFKFPRKITTNPCRKPCEKPCEEPCEPCEEPFEKTFNYTNSMRPCCVKQTRPKCVPKPPKPCPQTCLQKACHKCS